MRIMGVESAPALYEMKPTMADVMTKQKRVMQKNSNNRLPNDNDSFIKCVSV
jgi:hypothetical protein